MEVSFSLLVETIEKDQKTLNWMVVVVLVSFLFLFERMGQEEEELYCMVLV